MDMMLSKITTLLILQNRSKTKDFFTWKIATNIVQTTNPSVLTLRQQICSGKKGFNREKSNKAFRKYTKKNEKVNFV